MIKIIIFMYVIGTSSICYANGFDDLPEVKSLQQGMPKEVAAFIPRVVECNHFGGEEAYDKERTEFLMKAVEEAGCSEIHETEARLRKKYKSNQKVLKVIQKAQDLIF
jgi:hypothetical protein